MRRRWWQCSGGPGPRGGRQVRVRVGDVLDELLGHEERFWQGTAGRLGLLGGPAGMAAGMLRQIVAAGALLGASSQEQAVHLLGRVPRAVASVQVASWLGPVPAESPKCSMETGRNGLGRCGRTGWPSAW